MENKISIQYLYNSGFTIDFNDYFIIIDYFEGDLVLPENKKIVFIVSHAHSDHYNPAIFTYPGSDNAYYMISSDVEPMIVKDNIIMLSDTPKKTEYLKKLYKDGYVYRANPNDSFDFSGISFNTFASTDAGISVLFELYGVIFFHSGDLNAWKWKNDKRSIQAKEVFEYKEILNKIKNYKIDIGFGVVDARLEENAFVGPELYLKELKPQIFIPMHFRENYKITSDFKKKYSSQTDAKIQTILDRGDKIIISI